MSERIRLGVNVDHVATVRNARGGTHPDPVRAARLAAAAGADGITMHLREDRRHIIDADAEVFQSEAILPLNLEMAATEEMLAIVERIGPHAVCLVPEKREEKTTEGGLDVFGQGNALQAVVDRLKASGARVSLFIDPERRQLEAAARLGAPVVELHTGAYAEAVARTERAAIKEELATLIEGAKIGGDLGLEVHAGHGLTYDNVQPVAAIPEVRELNIGHFLIGEAVFMGLDAAIREMRRLMDDARGYSSMKAR
ncbi:MAG: pyridoxine 5'-phosphate synthase [Pseudomonadota bacterium]